MLVVKEIMKEQSLRCKSCGSANQKKFIGEMGIRSPGLKNIDKPIVWVFPNLLSAWIVARRNSSCPKLNCVYLQKVTPLRQDDLVIRLTHSSQFSP